MRANIMNSERLIHALYAALPSIPQPGEPDYSLTLLLHKASENPTHSDSSLVGLLEVLRAESELEIFNGYMQVVGNTAVRVEFVQLAYWLLNQSRKVGVEQTVKDLQRYLEAEKIDYEYTAAIEGLTLHESCSFTSELELKPWNMLPESTQKLFVQQKSTGGFSFHFPTAALIRKMALPKVHFKGNNKDKFHNEIYQLSRSEIEDAVLCAGLFGPTAPFILATWVEPPDWAPIMSGSYIMPHYEGHIMSSEWPKDAHEKAPNIYRAFRELDDNRKARLQLSMQRLNKAIRRASFVDAAIDLGIVLESLFLSNLSDDRGELTFRLRIRAARYLNTEVNERRRFYKLVGNLYDLRSAATHTGNVSKTIGGIATTDLIKEGFALAASTIVRFIIEGEPDWQFVTLS